MHNELTHRLVALVSYGTGFLRNENSLEDWYRHGAFHNARSIFRASADNALLADDFTLWLSILKGAGAVRLSLHGPGEFSEVVPRDERRRAFTVVAHFADAWQIWTVGTEQAAWREAPALVDSPDYWYYFNAISHCAAIDTYWCGEKMPGTLDVPATDWKALTATIAADLDIKLPSGRGPAAPFSGPEANDSMRTALPLLPQSKAWPAHRLASALALAQAKFANDTNPKNEANIYLGLNAEGEARLQNWGRRLDNWMTEVLMRGANEGTGSGATSPGLPAPAPQPGTDGHVGNTPAGGETPAAPPQPGLRTRATLGGWGARIGLAIATVVLSVFFAAVAHFVAAYPWLAIFIGLPFALHLHFKTRDRQA